MIYAGSVQGVGFRFTAERIAQQLGVLGFVKNLPDGNVEIVGEGRKEQLENFLKNMDSAMRGYISDLQVDWEPACGEFSSFGIQF